MGGGRGVAERFTDTRIYSEDGYSLLEDMVESYGHRGRLVGGDRSDTTGGNMTPGTLLRGSAGIDEKDTKQRYTAIGAPILLLAPLRDGVGSSFQCYIL